jgi:hypothetical protein
MHRIFDLANAALGGLLITVLPGRRPLGLRAHELARRSQEHLLANEAVRRVREAIGAVPPMQQQVISLKSPAALESYPEVA